MDADSSVSPQRDASFVVRIWWEHPAEGAPILRGRVEHAASGEAVYFQDFRALEAFITRRAERETGEHREPRQAPGQEADSHE